MNRDQRQILAALDANGWHRVASWSYRQSEFGDVVARVHPCRTVHVLRWRERRPNGGGVLDGIEYVQPLYGRTWAARTARIVHALATSRWSPRELGILLHAIGGGGRSRDRLGWRNHFCPGGDDVAVCCALVDAGLMEVARRCTGTDTTYRVTTLGAAEVGVTL